MVILDISKHNGKANFRKMKEAGVDAVVARATVGDYYIDTEFEANYEGAKEVGMPFGPYHVIAPERPVNAQIDNLLFALQGKTIDLPFTMDCELSRNQKRSTITASIMKHCKDLTAMGHSLWIYTRQSWWDVYVMRSPYWKQFPLWVANYTLANKPLLPLDWDTWLLWQHSADGNDMGEQYGVESDSVDMSRVNEAHPGFAIFKENGQVVVPESEALLRLRPGFYLRNQPEQINKTIVSLTQANTRIKKIGESGEWLKGEIWVHKSAVE